MYLSHLAVHAANRGKFLEAPQEVINRFQHIADPNRRTFAGNIQIYSLKPCKDFLEAKNFDQGNMSVFFFNS